MTKRKKYLFVGLVLAILLLAILLIAYLKLSKDSNQVSSLVNEKDNDKNTSAVILIEDGANDAKVLSGFSGDWEWEKNSETRMFFVNIEEKDGYYVGRYSAIAHDGMFIDSDYDDDDYSFVIEKLFTDEAIVDFLTYYSRTKGKVKLSILDGKLYWDIIEEPDGLYFCPNNAVLIRSEKATRMTKVDKLIKASWSNMGSWILLYDPSIEDYENSVVLEIGFHGELEDMGRGGKNAYVVETLIELLNSKFDKGIQLALYSNDGKRLELVYQNGICIEWDYASKKEPTEV